MKPTNENIFTIGELRLVSGVGNYSEATACVMSAARAIYRIEQGLPIGEASDELECCCPVVHSLCIARNDGPWPSDEARTSWGRRIIPRIIGSRRDREETQRRAYRCADVAVRQIAPLALRAAGLTKQAETLEWLPEVTNRESAANAANAADAANAANAAYAARAAARAAAYAARAAANAAADAAADAANAADAAARAADAADAAYATWDPIDALIEEFLELDRRPLHKEESRKLNLQLTIK